MKDINNNIVLVKDKATRDVLTALTAELERIKSISPAKEDLKSLAIAINKITGKIK